MVEGARLEIVWARKRLGGSNPLASARKSRKIAQMAVYVDFFAKRRRGSSQVRIENEVFDNLSSRFAKHFLRFLEKPCKQVFIQKLENGASARKVKKYQDRIFLDLEKNLPWFS